MLIYYRNSRTRRDIGPTGLKEPFLELTVNTWNDFGFRTTLNAILHQDSGDRSMDRIKILFKDQANTIEHLNRMVKDGWDGIFPPPDSDFVSLPETLSFYEELIGELGPQTALRAAAGLRDASYMTHTASDPVAWQLVTHTIFQDSLLRERGAQRAYNEGWKLWANLGFASQDMVFRFLDADLRPQELHLAFGSKSVLPHDINVLIGPNGCGKSQFLRQLVEHWLQVEDLPNWVGFTEPSDFSQLVVVSYSPFEQMRVDTEGLEIADRDVYRYFGLRGRAQGRRTEPTLSLDYPKRKAVQSLIDCASDDRRYGSIDAWSKKLAVLYDVLRESIDFEYLAVEVPGTMRASSFHLHEGEGDELVEWIGPDEAGRQVAKRAVAIHPATVGTLNLEAIARHASKSAELQVFRDGTPLRLSSGQQLFLFVVVNLLGSIRRNSLVLIDEPELFLHPTLEITLIGMLKTILQAYACKALIATHSLVIVREVPSDCVHVMERTPDGVVLKNPPFQTFGGDVQRISSYVFGDKAVTKPFEIWIEAGAAAVGGRGQLLESLRPEELNEELILELRDAPVRAE